MDQNNHYVQRAIQRYYSNDGTKYGKVKIIDLVKKTGGLLNVGGSLNEIGLYTKKIEDKFRILVENQFVELMDKILKSKKSNTEIAKELIVFTAACMIIGKACCIPLTRLVTMLWAPCSSVGKLAVIDAKISFTINASWPKISPAIKFIFSFSVPRKFVAAVAQS